MGKLAPPVVAVVGYFGFLAAMAATYSRLPEVVASHFNANGAPNGWMPRDSYVWTMVGVVTFTTALLAGMFALIRYLPKGMVNLPNRDYWLAPERRAETSRTLGSYGLVMAGLVSLNFMGLQLLVVKANESQPVELSSGVWWILAGFLAITGTMTVAIYRRFSRVH
jgi:uncharacterized membrane protein